MIEINLDSIIEFVTLKDLELVIIVAFYTPHELNGEERMESARYNQDASEDDLRPGLSFNGSVNNQFLDANTE